MSACVMFALASAYSLWRDLGPFRNTVSDARLSEDFADTAAPLGLSSYSKALVMKDCFRSVSGYSDIEMLSDPNQRVTAKCAVLAGETVAATPSDSFAWLVKAAAAARLYDTAAFNEALLQSRKTGPNEQWISALRVRVAERHLSLLSPDAVEAEQADLRMLASSEKGIREISDRYVNSPDFRDRITAIVEKMPSERQQAFIAGIQRVIKKG